jgi:hypothetical protein
MYWIASHTDRMQVLRGRPTLLGPGINGSIKAHSASVQLLAAERSSVMLTAGDFGPGHLLLRWLRTPSKNHNLLKSPNFNFRSAS